MIIFPAVDIIGGKTVRLEQGRYDRELKYSVSPLQAARRWKDAGASWLHLIDLEGAKTGRPVNLDTIAAITADTGLPVQTGGGYRNCDDIQKALDTGVERVIIGSAAVEDIATAEDLIRKFKEKIIISCDAEALELKSRGWLRSGGVDMFEFFSELSSFGAGRIIYTDIQRDGTLAGPAFDNIERVLRRTGLKVISAGGVTTLDDVKKLKALEPMGLEGVIVGRALYEGTLDLKEAIDVG